jgi:hypothetical protein
MGWAAHFQIIAFGVSALFYPLPKVAQSYAWRLEYQRACVISFLAGGLLVQSPDLLISLTESVGRVSPPRKTHTRLSRAQTLMMGIPYFLIGLILYLNDILIKYGLGLIGAMISVWKILISWSPIYVIYSFMGIGKLLRKQLADFQRQDNLYIIDTYNMREL